MGDVTSAPNTQGRGRDRHLVSIELRFVVEDRSGAEALAERVKEAARSVVGREALEEFRWRALPLDREKKP
jgi:hypothetical protein